MTDPRPNVLWVIGEDLGPHLGCYGERAIDTPNADRLAREGTLFENAAVTCPVCSPSRSAINAGTHQGHFGAQHHRSGRDTPLPADVTLVSDAFRRAGYFTCNNGGPPFDAAGKTDFNFHVEAPFDGIDWSERPEGAPFFAQVQLYDAHRMRRFGHGRADGPPDPDTVVLPSHEPDHPLMRRDRGLYLDSVRRVDRKLGEVLDRLDREGLAESTIVVLMSDHGPGHIRGKQFCYEEGLRIPLIARFPGAIAAGERRSDLVSAIDLAPTSLALAGAPVPDSMTGRVVLGPERAPARDAVFAARDRCDGAVDRIRSVRADRWKYIRNFLPDRSLLQFSAYKEAFYPGLPLLRLLGEADRLAPGPAALLAEQRASEELYDLEADPEETTNLAAEPAHAASLDAMRGRLDAWQRETGDRGMTPEPARVVADWRKHMAAQFAAWMEGRGVPRGADDATFLRFWDRHIADQGGWAPLYGEDDPVP